MNALTTIRNRLLRHSAIVVASTIVMPLAAQPAFAQTETSAGDVSASVGAPVITDIVGGAPVVPGIVDGVQVDLTVKQSVIDWTHFNIVDSTRTIQFSDTTGLPAGTVVSVLNRVVGSAGKAIETSVINGTLKSDSNVVVWISNPNGITFGSTGVFSGGSLVLTTAAITNADFTDNNQGYTLTGAPYYMLDKSGAESSKAGLSTITLANGSNITTSGDFAAAAQNITASGTVKASGEVALIAAQDIDLAINPGSPIGYTIKAGTTVGSAKLRADGSIEAGSIVLTGAGRRTAGSESDLLLEIGNSLTATSVGGRIFLGTVTDVSDTIGGNNDAIQLVANTTLKGTTIEIASKLDSDATARGLTITGDAKLGAIIGGTAALDAISVSGTTDFLAAGTTGAPSVTTVNTQDYTGASTLSENTVLKGSVVTMGGEVNGAKAYEVQGDAVFTKALGNSTALTTVLVTGKTDFQYAGATGSPSVTTTSTQDYQGAATLTGNTVLKGTTVTMGGTVNGAKLLEVQGDAVFKNTIGNTTALTTVTVTGKTDFQAAGTTATPSVTTTGAQDYQGAATLTGNTVLKGSTVTFGNTVNGGKALEIQGDAVLTNALGNATALASVLVTGKTDFQYAGTTANPSVTTTGTQEYQGAATLTVDTVLKGSTATFGGTVNGAKLLEVQGNAVLKGIVGGTTALTTVTVTGKTDFQAAGTTATPSVTTTGAQDYQGAATVTGNTVLKGTTVTMGGTVNGAKLLEVQGDVVLKGIVGGTTALTSVTVTGKTDFQAAGTTATPSVTTTGTQEYQGAATLTGNTVLKGTTVTMGGTVNGGKLLEVQGDAVFKNPIGNTTALTTVTVTGKTDFQAAGTSGTPSVTTTGAQDYQGAATLTGNTVLKGSTVTFGNTVNGGKALEIQGDAVLTNALGNTTALASVLVTGKTDFQYAGTTPTPSVTTTGTQEYQGVATLTADTVLKGSTATFGGTVNGAKLLEVQGNAVLKGIVGGTTALTTVTVTGKTDFQAAGTTAIPSVTTTGAQDYQGAATVTGNTVLKGTTVTMGGTVNGAKLLEVQGDAVLKGIVGGTTALTKQLESIEVSGGTAITAAANADLNAVKFIKLDATGPITTAGLTTTGVTGDILVNQNGGAGTVVIGGNVSATGKYYVTGTSVALGDASARTQSAAGNVSITATTGNVTQGAGLLTLQSDRLGAGTQPLNVSSTAGSVTLANSVLVGGTITGPVTFGHESDVSVTAFNGAVLDDLHGLNVSVFSSTGTASANWASAFNNIEVNGGQASLGLGDGPNAGGAGGYIHVLSGTGASSSTLGTGRAVGDIWVYSVAGSATLLTSATSTNSSVTIDGGTLATAGGDVSAKTVYVVTGGTGVVLGDAAARTQTAGGAVTITATTGNVTQGSGRLTLQSNNDGVGTEALSVTATTGSVTLANSQLVGGTISGSTYGLQSDVTVTADKNATLAELAGLNVKATATNGLATVLENVAAKADYTVTGGTGVVLGDATSRTQSAGGKVTITAATGIVTQGSAPLTLISDNDGTGSDPLTVKALTGAVTLGNSLLSGGNITFTFSGAVYGNTSDVLVDAATSAQVTELHGLNATVNAAGGDATVVNAGAANAIAITASNNASLGTGKAGGTILVKGTAGTATLGDATSTGSSITVNAGTLATVSGTISAKTAYAVTGGTGVVLGDATARTQAAGGAVTITATTGNVTQGAGLLTLQSDNDGTGSDPLTIKALTGNVTLGNALLAGGTISGSTYGKQSDVLVDAKQNATLIDLRGLNTTVAAQTGNATVTTADAAQAVSVTAPAGAASLGTGTAGTSILVSGVSGSLGNGTAGTTLSVLGTTGDASLTTGKAGGAVLVKSTGANANVVDATSTGSSITVNAGTLATVSGTISAKTAYAVTGGTGVVLGDATARTQAAGGAVTITATTGNVTQGAGLLTLQSDNDGTGSDPLTIKALTGNVTLGNALLAGGTISGSTYGKQSDVLVDAKQNATLIDLRGLNTTVAAQTGNATVTTADAAQAVSVTAPAGAASLGTGTAGTSILVSGVSGSLGNGTAGTTLSVLGTTGDASLTTGKAGGAVLVKSTGANANVVDATSTGASITVDGNKLATISGTISAKTAYTVTGGTGVVLGDATARTQAAGGAVMITATTGNVTQGSGLLTLQSDNDGTGGDPLTIKALTGSVTLGNSAIKAGTSRQSDVLIDAADNASLVLVDGRDIAIKTNRIALGGAVTGGNSVTLTNRSVRADGTTAAVNNTVIGAAGDEASLYVLTAAEIANVTAPNVRVVTEQPATGTKQNVTLDTFALKSAVTRYEFLTTPATTGTPVPKITLVGAITGSDFAGTLQIGGTSTSTGRSEFIEAQLETATIDLPKATLELRADKIVFGVDSLRNNATVTGGTTAQIASDIVSNAGSVLYNAEGKAKTITNSSYALNTFLRAKVMKVSYTNFALFQNTLPGQMGGVHLGVSDSAVDATTLALDLDSKPVGSEDAFGMFGKINGFIGRTAGLLPESVIVFSDGTGTGRTVRITQSNSRINGCVIGSPDKGCLITDVQPPALKLFDERQAQIFTTGDEDTRIILDPLVATNNEALLGDLAVPTLNYEVPTCELKADKTCKETK